MTKKKKTILSAGIAVAIAATVAVGFTLAYLNATQSVTNKLTFVNGSNSTTLNASLTEPNFDPASALNLEPGTTVPKNPEITNTTGMTAADPTVQDPNGEVNVTNTGALTPLSPANPANVPEWAMIQLEFQGINASGQAFDLQPWQINELMKVITFNSSTASGTTGVTGLDTTDWTLDTAQTNYADSVAAAPPGTTATPNFVDYIYNTEINSYYDDGATQGAPETTHPLFDSFTVNASADNQMMADIAAWAPGGIQILCNGAVVQTDNLTDTSGATPVISSAGVSALETLVPVPAAGSATAESYDQTTTPITVTATDYDSTAYMVEITPQDASVY